MTRKEWTELIRRVDGAVAGAVEWYDSVVANQDPAKPNWTTQADALLNLLAVLESEHYIKILK